MLSQYEYGPHPFISLSLMRVVALERFSANSKQALMGPWAKPHAKKILRVVAPKRYVCTQISGNKKLSPLDTGLGVETLNPKRVESGWV